MPDDDEDNFEHPEANCSPEEYEAAWDAEIERRLAEVESGKVALIPWEEARKLILGERQFTPNATSRRPLVGTPKNKHARRYYRVAKQRLAEATLILNGVQLPAAAEYLAGYAVECILKALILALVPESQLPGDWKGIVAWLKQEFGHDLNSLRDEVRRRGQNVPKDVSDAMDFVVENWRPESRYTPGPGDFDHANDFLRTVDFVVQWADRSI